MRFKSPGGSLNWLTLVWLVASSLVTYHCYTTGRYGMGGLFACLAISCVLVWFDVRFIYKPLVAFWLVAIASGFLTIILRGITLRLVSQIVLAGYTIYALWEWGTEYERTADQLSSAEDELEETEEVELA